LVVTEKSKVGEVDQHVIWEVKGTDIIPFTKTTIHLNELQVRDNKEYVSLIQHAISMPGFYFSYTYDLTHTVQRIKNRMDIRENFHQLPLFNRADERFLWNGHVARDLTVQPELKRFVVPLIHGFVSVKDMRVNGKLFTFVLISRRSVHRAGTRYYMRGLDLDGHAANYVETEQIVIHSDHKASFVQTRGSIPLLWSQRPNLTYKPRPLLVNSPAAREALGRHFNEQISYYGRQVLVNLIDQKGKEKEICEMFGREIQGYDNGLLRYLHFDFHKECSKMRWHRLSILMDKLDQDQATFGYYYQNRDGVVESHQSGVFRANCMDCLDRTNVVQSMLARRSLLSQLRRMRVLSLGETVELHDNLEKTFKNVWADNANMCSLQYAGTGALKTDFTRTGKRTRMGAVKDGINSVTRYYYNNFVDGFRQDAMDLFLGNHIVSRDEDVTIPSVLQPPRNLRVTVLPLILLFGLAMLVLSFLLVSGEGSINYQLSYVAFWFAAVALTLWYMIRHGKEFVNSPRLAADSFLNKKSL
jgi:hypothetical protein